VALLKRGNWEEIPEKEDEYKSLYNANFIWIGHNFSVRKWAVMD
jgi:hypothetical protein